MSYGNRTIVTEVKTRVVNKKGRESFHRTNDAVRASEIIQDSFTVSTNEHKVIENIGTHFKLETQHPVILSMLQGTGVQHPTVEMDVYEPHTAHIDTEFEDGEIPRILIRVNDPDIIGSSSVRVVAFNTITGETEYVTLNKEAVGVYSGHLNLVYTKTEGENFDGYMYYSSLQPICISMLDQVSSEGKPIHVTNESMYPAPSNVPRIYVRDPLDGKVQIRIDNLPEGDYNLLVNGAQVTPDFDVNNSMLCDAGDGDTVTVELLFSYNGINSSVLRKIPNELSLPVLSVTPEVEANGYMIIELRDASELDSTASVMVFSGDVNKSIQLESIDGTGTFGGTFNVSEFEYDSDFRIGVSYSYKNDASYDILKAYTTVDVSDEEDSVESIQLQPIEIYVDGCFVFNGSFTGTISIRPAKDEEIVCSCIIAR